MWNIFKSNKTLESEKKEKERKEKYELEQRTIILNKRVESKRLEEEEERKKEKKARYISNEYRKLLCEISGKNIGYDVYRKQNTYTTKYYYNIPKEGSIDDLKNTIKEAEDLFSIFGKKIKYYLRVSGTSFSSSSYVSMPEYYSIYVEDIDIKWLEENKHLLDAVDLGLI